MAKKSLIIFLGILTLGFIFRIYRITNLPMYGDELTMVYDSYSIVKTGMDQTGERLPLTFKMGAGRPAGYIYFSIPFVLLFGPTALGIRALSLISGLATIVLIFFLARKLFNLRVAYIASLLMAISPWDLSLSRAGFEAHFALFLSLAGIVAFLFDRKWSYLLWAFFWGLALHTYPTFKLTLPIIFLVLLWYKGDPLKSYIKKSFLVGLLTLSLFVGLGIRETVIGRSEERFFSLNIFSKTDLKEQITEKINYERKISQLPTWANEIFHNKGTEYARLLKEGYFKNFSTEFLILSGDRNPRHNPAEAGGIYFIELVTIGLGLLILWQKNKKTFVLLVLWMFIGPTATSFLLEPHFLRSSLMLPPIILLSSYGLSQIRSRYIVGGVIVAVFIQLVFNLERTYFVAPERHAEFWSKEAKEKSLAAIENKDKKDVVVLSTRIDNIEYAYPVYAKIDPKLVIEQYGKFPKIYGNVVITDK